MIKKYLIDKDKIVKILKRNNYTLKEYKLHKGSNGVINTIYFIKTKENKNLVLRIINPEKRWKKRKTINEVEVLKFINKNTTVPVPEIIDYSIKTNFIGYEYILMTRLKGNILKNYDKLDSKQRLSYISQIVNYVSQINKFQFNKIGNFKENMVLTKLVDINKGPFEYYSDYIYNSIKFYINKADKNKFKKEIKLVSNFNNKYIKNKKIKTLYTLCHFDLSIENILVLDGKVTGFVDFEWSGSYPLLEEFIIFKENFKLDKYKNSNLKFKKILTENKIKQNFSKSLILLSELQLNVMCLSEYKNWHNNEKKAELFINGVIKEIYKIMSIYKK